MTPDELSNHYIQNTALPFFPNDSPTAKQPAYVEGSNVLTSIRGYAERRNGFATFLSDTTWTFSGTVQRFFTWRRWTGASITLSGSYFEMYCETSATQSRVWKRRVGTDAVPVNIFTSSSSTVVFDFCVSNDFVFFGNGVDMKKYDGSNVWNWGITAPASAVTVTTTTGSLSPVIGYKYVICWDNSSTTHVSSPSPVSTDTGAQTNQNFILTGNTTTDGQVDRVRVFRTIDGGSIYFEHPSSPVTYATWTASGLTDSSADSALSSNVAPLPNQNNRPTASLDPVWFANRIWTHIDDTLYYSDFEELVRGVEEESFASTNFRFFGEEIVAKRVAGQYLLIFTANNIYRIYGDSLATFRMDTLASGKGALNRACVISMRGLVAWLDSSSCIFVTDGTTVPERDLSYPIRSEISSITQASAALAFHSTGNTHWLLLMDGGAGNIYTYDLDTQQWMPPWPISNLQAIYSGQTALASYRLFLGRNGKPLQQNTNYQDDGSNYTARLRMNLFDLVEEGNPSKYGILDHIALESGTVVTTTVGYLTDEDPSGASYQATASTGNAPPNRTQGTNLVETWYPTLADPNLKGARRVSVEMNWAAANSNFLLYGINLSYKEVD